LLASCPDPATAALSPLSLHDALPISGRRRDRRRRLAGSGDGRLRPVTDATNDAVFGEHVRQRAREIIARYPQGRERSALLPLLRSEEHTSELQSRENLVCRLLLEKKK